MICFQIFVYSWPSILRKFTQCPLCCPASKHGHLDMATRPVKRPVNLSIPNLSCGVISLKFYDSDGFPMVRSMTNSGHRDILIRACQIEYNEKLLDYRFLDAPHFEFGFGLSYTTFSYPGLSIPASTGQYAYTVSFTVRNTGIVDGTEIPQLYLVFSTDIGEPKPILKSFDEVKLAAGTSSTISLGLTARDIRFVIPPPCICLLLILIVIAVSEMSLSSNRRGLLGPSPPILAHPSRTYA